MEEEYDLLSKSFHGYVGLCPSCFERAMWVKDGKELGQKFNLVEFEKAKDEAAKNVSDNMCLRFKLQCGCEIKFNDKIILVDEAIAHPVQIFNKLLYNTTNCCAGHPFDPVKFKIYLNFDKTYTDILTAYQTLRHKDEFKHLKFIMRESDIDNEKTNSYVLEPNGEFRHIGSYNGCKLGSYYSLEFDRSVYEVLTNHIYYEDLNTWIKNSELFFKSEYMNYGPMSSTAAFTKCLYLLIEELLKMRR